MDLHIRGNDVTISDSLRTHAETRVSTLERLLDHVVDAKLELRHRHQRQGGDVIVAQLTIQNGKRVMRAEEEDHDAQRAIDKVAEKMQHQVRKAHDRKAKHFARHGTAAAVMGNAEPPTTGSAEETLVRRKQFAVQPMDHAEAIEQMELLGHDFFLFQDADAAQLNVLYRRSDGSYGLLVPELS